MAHFIASSTVIRRRVLLRVRAAHRSGWTYPESKKNHPSTRQDHEEQHDRAEECGLLLLAMRLFVRTSYSAHAIEPRRQDHECDTGQRKQQPGNDQNTTQGVALRSVEPRHGTPATPRITPPGLLSRSGLASLVGPAEVRSLR